MVGGIGKKEGMDADRTLLHDVLMQIDVEGPLFAPMFNLTSLCSGCEINRVPMQLHLLQSVVTLEESSVAY